MVIEVRRIKYQTNIVDPDHSVARRNTPPLLGLKSFSVTANVLMGIESEWA